MNIIEELKNHSERLNDFQTDFISCTEDLFSEINKKNIGINSFVRFDSNNILEINLVQPQSADFILLFLIHEDIIEIGCLDYIYFFDTKNDSMFKELSKNDIFIKIQEIVYHMLKAKFKLFHYSFKGKLIKSKIIWEHLDFLNQQRNYSIFSYFYKNRILDKKEIFFGSFIN
jgi:hypothetical protein